MTSHDSTHPLEYETARASTALPIIHLVLWVGLGWAAISADVHRQPDLADL